jgi:Rod binding domain-containing protein
MPVDLPPIDAPLLPADVREAGPQARKLYVTALAFESVLTQELAQALTSTLQLDPSADDGDRGSDAATTLTAQLLPDALSRNLTAAGGLGLARQLYEALGGTGATAKTGNP